MSISKLPSDKDAKIPYCNFYKFNCDCIGWKDMVNNKTFTEGGTIPAGTYTEGDSIVLKAQ